MSTATTVAQAPPARRQIVPHAVLGITVFVIAESMFFAGLISAHTIIKMGTVGAWPPVGQPRLPAQETLLNTGALLLSGLLLAVGLHLHKKKSRASVALVLLATLLGAAFIALQGREWVMMLNQGLTLTSSAHGSFFYMIVGAHALHAIAGLLAVAYLFVTMWTKKVTPGRIGATAIYWYFVVLLWPILYAKVYF